MRKILVHLLAILCIVGVNTLWAADNRLVLTGSSTVAPLALEIGKRFEQQNPGVRVDVQTGGSTRGVNDVLMGLADIGMASRGLKAGETGLAVYTIAMDGICIIVNQQNPVSALTNTQIIDIYTGKIRNWQQLGGRDQAITVINKAEGRSTLELFLQYFSLKNSQVKPDVIIGDNEQGIKTVAGNAGAIGYVSIGTAEYAEQQAVAIKSLPMDGVSAKVSSVRDKRFPLIRPLNFLVKGQPSALAKRYIEFAQSAAVNNLIEAQYFVAPH